MWNGNGMARDLTQTASREMAAQHVQNSVLADSAYLLIGTSNHIWFGRDAISGIGLRLGFVIG